MTVGCAAYAVCSVLLCSAQLCCYVVRNCAACATVQMSSMSYVYVQKKKVLSYDSYQSIMQTPHLNFWKDGEREKITSNMPMAHVAPFQFWIYYVLVYSLD